VTTRARRWLFPAAAVVLVGCTTPGAGPTSLPATTIAGAWSGSPAGSRSIAGLKQPFGVATEKGDVWVTEYQSGNLVRIDGSSNRITRVHVGPHASHVVIQGGVAWVVDDLGSAVIGVDTEAARVVKDIPLRANAFLRPNAIAAGDGSIWVTLGLSTEYPPVASVPTSSQLVRLVPGGNDEVSTTNLTGVLAGVVVGGGAVWVASVLDPVTIYRVDPVTKRIVASIDTGHPVSGALAYLDPDLWVANRDGYLTRIDARTNRIVGNFEVGSPEWPAVVAQGQAIWISAPLDNIVARFDIGTGAISKTVRTGSRPQGFAFLGNDIWVANYLDGTVVKLPIN
jgi:streptogramin lyase